MNDTQEIETFLRGKLDELQARYKVERTPEVSEAFLRTLKLFTALVLQKKRPTRADLKWIKHA
jgi:hypothetical protein